MCVVKTTEKQDVAGSWCQTGILRNMKQTCEAEEGQNQTRLELAQQLEALDLQPKNHRMSLKSLQKQKRYQMFILETIMDPLWSGRKVMVSEGLSEEAVSCTC